MSGKGWNSRKKGERERLGQWLRVGLVLVLMLVGLGLTQGQALGQASGRMEAQGEQQGAQQPERMELGSSVASLEGRSLPWLVEEAARAYQGGDYAGAVRLYQAALRGGAVNGEVYYNLGNAWQRQGKVGEAILAYRRAQLFLPRDGDVEANLGYVRERRVDRLEPEGVPAWKRVLFWYEVLSLGELLGLVGGVNVVFWGLLGVKRWKPELELRLPVWVSGLAVGLLLSSWGVKRWEEEVQPVGVVLESSVSVRSGTDVKSVVLFTLSEGSEVRTRGMQGEWVQVEAGEGKRGWVERRFMGLVQP
ncbi:MAG: tetratricopeptide repeat protein [Myxococcota bacterium]